MTQVTITQHLLPNGNREREMMCDVPDEVALMAQGMILSAEMLRTGEVVIYARYEDEPDDLEILGIAQNGPGAESPASVLVGLIREKHAGASRNTDTGGC